MYNFRGFFSEVNGLQVNVIHSPGKTLCSLELPILPVIDHNGGPGTSDSMLVNFGSICKIISDVGHRGKGAICHKLGQDAHICNPLWFWEILVILGRLGRASIVILRPSPLGNSALSFSIIEPGMNSTMSK